MGASSIEFPWSCPYLVSRRFIILKLASQGEVLRFPVLLVDSSNVHFHCCYLHHGKLAAGSKCDLCLSKLDKFD